MPCTVRSARLLTLVLHRPAQSHRLSLQPLDLASQRRRLRHHLLRHRRPGHGWGGRHGGSSSGVEQVLQLRLCALCPRQRQRQLLPQRSRLRAELISHRLLELIQLIVVREGLRPSRERLWYLDMCARSSMRGALEIERERRQHWEGAGGYQPIGWREGGGCVVPPLLPWQHPASAPCLTVAVALHAGQSAVLASNLHVR